jgi:hypothetical protein
MLLFQDDHGSTKREASLGPLPIYPFGVHGNAEYLNPIRWFRHEYATIVFPCWPQGIPRIELEKFSY